ncbi:MAG: thymidine phosphorylase [Acidobacteria bacterium]|nr:thymidine phosphorylase [Acidobacteriota bacterium]
MTPQDLIRKKRDGARFSENEIEAFIAGVSDGSWADYQITALVMAMFIHGLNMSEQNALVRAMLHSGETLDFSDIDAPVADKHSTGGVGDKTSLIIAPLAAACGVAVPMISGRGLGHTGGTLDKLESIDGYNVRLSSAQIKRTLKKCGFALAGQTKRIVPADRKLYALRDACAMVESVPLIVASIMSKKLAEDLDALVLDVKTGNGAFMENLWDARVLAKYMVAAGTDFGVKTEAVITNMSEPLGRFAGNALEVYECLKIMRGEVDELSQPTLDLSLELTARMVVLCGIAKDLDDANAMCLEKLWDGSALERFRLNIELQKGDPTICDTPEKMLTKGIVKAEIKAADSGFVSEIDTRAVGDAICALGGGRVKAEDLIDYAVGFECAARLGDKIAAGDLIGTVYARSKSQAATISEKLRTAYKIGGEKPENLGLIHEVVR